MTSPIHANHGLVKQDQRANDEPLHLASTRGLARGLTKIRRPAVQKVKRHQFPLKKDNETYLKLMRVQACFRAFGPAAGAARRGRWRSILRHGNISASEKDNETYLRLSRWRETQGIKEVRRSPCLCTSFSTGSGIFRNNVRLQASKQRLPGTVSTILPQDCPVEALRSTVSRPCNKKINDHQIPVALLSGLGAIN
jgi:hypothetical protein